MIWGTPISGNLHMPTDTAALTDTYIEDKHTDTVHDMPDVDDAMQWHVFHDILIGTKFWHVFSQMHYPYTLTDTYCIQPFWPM